MFTAESGNLELCEILKLQVQPAVLAGMAIVGVYSVA